MYSLSQLFDSALAARNHIQCSFTVRLLDEDDIILSSVSSRGNHTALFIFESLLLAQIYVEPITLIYYIYICVKYLKHFL